MNLYLFPESPLLTNGYGIVVDSDFVNINPSDSDMIIWYTNSNNNPKIEVSHLILKRPGTIDLKRLSNMAMKKVGSEVKLSELLFLKKINFDTIFCGDVLFYRALRKLFPSKYLKIRFHNCFSRILDRKRLLKIDIDLKFNVDLHLMYKLEQEIFLDKNVQKIFLSEEDKAYYNLMTGSDDSFVWGVNVDFENGKLKRKTVQFYNQLVWFGGAESHKKESLVWFIENVFPGIRLEIPEVVFHLWGNRTKKFNNPKNNIYGHGYYDGYGLPMQRDALYVCPDILGGGVKIKIKTYFEEGVSFITTPFGYEGYNPKYIDNYYCIVKEPNSWTKTIIDLLKNSSSS